LLEMIIVEMMLLTNCGDDVVDDIDGD